MSWLPDATDMTVVGEADATSVMVDVMRVSCDTTVAAAEVRLNSKLDEVLGKPEGK